jgi:hypothetical protein
MRERSVGRSYVGYLIGGIFALVGLGLLIAGIFWHINNKAFFENAVEIQASITDIEIYYDSDNEAQHEVYVKYVIGDELYEDVRLNYYSSDMRKGQKVAVWYNPNDPWEIRSKEGSNFGSLLLIIIGGVFAGGGAIALITCQVKASQDTKRKKTGKRLQLPIAYIDVNPHITVNGFPANYIICQEQDPYTGQTIQQYKSKNIFRDLFSEMQVGDLVDVYVDPQNPNKYFVDVDSVQPNPYGSNTVY